MRCRRGSGSSATPMPPLSAGSVSPFGWLVAPVVLPALALSPAGRLAMPVIAFATVDFVVARTVVTGLGDYGPSYPGWAHLQWTDVLALTVAPLVAYGVVRACLAVLTRDADAAVPSAG